MRHNLWDNIDWGSYMNPGCVKVVNHITKLKQTGY